MYRTAILLGAISAGAIGILTLTSTISCATADFKDAPDAGGLKYCNPNPIIFCDAGTPGPSCTVVNVETDPHLARLLPGTYPEKCVVNYLSGAHDDNGDCVLDAVCKCEGSADAAAAPAWFCGP